VSGGAQAGRREDDSGATLVPGWRSGELADVIRRLLRGLLAACRLASDSVAGVTGTGGRQLTAMGFQAGQYRELRALGAAGPPGSLPRRRARVCPDADASAVSRQPGPQPVPGRNSPATASAAGPGRRGWQPDRSPPAAPSPAQAGPSRMPACPAPS
jgi:hypothetical protein